MRYQVFISYSNSDEELAKAIQVGLQDLAKPWNKRKALNVFRDSTSLPTSAALWPAIQKAIDRSEWFLYIASPSSANSEWVNREISYWLKTKSSDKLLIVLGNGSLEWDSSNNDFDTKRCSALAPPLFGAFSFEPKHLDLLWTKTHDKKLTLNDELFRDAVADLASPVHGIPKEDLNSKDLQQFKRNKRARIATGWVFLVLAVSVALIFLWAINQRSNRLRELSLSHADLAQQQTREGNVTQGVLIAIEALPKSLDKPERPYVNEAGAALFTGLNSLHERKIIMLDGGKYRKIARQSQHVKAELSPDGTQILSTSNWIVRLIDVEDGKPKVNLEGHTSPIYSAKFSPDGTMVVTASGDRTARLWEVETGKEIAILSGHNREVIAAQFSSDGSKILTHSFDETARLWDVASGKEIDIYDHNEIGRASFSPGGMKVLTASQYDENSIYIWDISTHRQISRHTGHKTQVVQAEFSPDESLVVTTSIDGTARVWSAHDGALVFEVGAYQDAFNDTITKAKFSPNGSLLVTAANNGVASIWQVPDGGELFSLARGESALTDAIFSFDGTRVLTSARDGTARLWSLPCSKFPCGTRHENYHGKLLAEFQSHDAELIGTAFFPDDTHAITFSRDGTARIWDPSPGSLFLELSGKNNKYQLAEFSKSGSRLATVSDDMMPRIWNTETGEQVVDLIGHRAKVNSVKFSDDGSLVATASRDNTVIIWDTNTAERLNILPTEGSATGASFSPDNSKVILTVADLSTPIIWDRSSGKTKKMVGHQKSIYHAEFSSLGRVLTASFDGTARIWDLSTNTSVPLASGRFSYGCPQFSPDGSQVLTTVRHSTILWDSDTGEQLDKLTSRKDINGVESTYKCARFSQNGSAAVVIESNSSSSPWNVRVWDLQSGEISDLPDHTGEVLYATFGDSGRKILTLIDDGTVQAWDSKIGSKLEKLTVRSRSYSRSSETVVFSPDGTLVITLCENNLACIWDLQISQKLVDRAISVLSRNELTLEEKNRFFIDRE